MLGASGGSTAVAEAVLSSAGHSLEVAHTAGALSTSAAHLHTPVVEPHLRVRVPTRRTLLLLNVHRSLATPLAKSVRLDVALAEARGSLRLCDLYHSPI